jgi:hypothetical protein
LAFFSQPWGTAEPRDPTPDGLRQPPSSNMQNRHNPFQGCEFDFFSPQGLDDEIPSEFNAIEFCMMPLVS